MSANPDFRLPAHFALERELLEQLSSRPGYQRCVDGDKELLLILHEVPEPGIPERRAHYFWKRADNRWMQAGGEGLSELGELLDRYAFAIDGHEEELDGVDSTAQLFPILRHSGPLSRSMRNLANTLEHTLSIDMDDRAVIELRDRARELERAAELLHIDAKMALDFLMAERAEAQADSTDRLNRIAFRLNLLAGFFLPLLALAGLFGMNVDLPQFIRPMFWVILLGGLVFGVALLYLVGHKTAQGFPLRRKRKR